MSLLAWNCRGLANSRTVRYLGDIVTQIRPSFIFLSEILVKKNVFEKVCMKLGFAGFHNVDSYGTGGGLVLMWKNDCNIVIKDNCLHYIDFKISIDQIGRWRYTGYYGCPERERRQESWNMLRDLAGRSTLSWCLIGDLNDMMLADEKLGGCAHPRRLLEGFTNTISDCQLMDLGFVGNRFTWERERGGNRWIQERLDRGLANSQWRNLFPHAEVIVLDVSTSDHLPLNLQLNRKMFAPKSHRFRFENMWLKEKDCLHIVQTCWREMIDQIIMQKIKFCCLKLEEWGGGMIKEFKGKIKNYKQRLKNLRSRRDRDGIRQYNEVRWEYLKLLEKQEIYWHQRAKQFWLQHGDQNTRFFHKYAVARKSNNSIDGLKD
ncbi:uncharacterized protein LOC141685051 [Apium graveolens]|uniref:uncharacterized protein LOC141685051 n=1 Tax=Apium graveolens TaxID=4045 RepID=UPI003D795AEB